MKTTLKTLTALTLSTMASAPVLATNGDNLIGIGPTSRSMGGVGVAAPQDAIGAVFQNPAAMCFGPYCPAAEFDFAGTLFMPHISAQVDGVSVDSHATTYAIPAIGLSIPVQDSQQWRFGLAAYGVSGLGVDYRGTALDNPRGFDFGGGTFAPLVAGEFTSLQIMKFAPSIAYQPLPNLSFGLALHIDYATLDLGRGTSTGYGIGIQPGIVYQPAKNISIGLAYVSSQPVDHRRVTDFEGDGTLDTLTLESPQQVDVGVAYEIVEDRLLIEADGRWINWAGADGYKDFGWKDQWVAGFGAQYAAIQKKLFLRAGYNFGENPVKSHSGWNGAFGPGMTFGSVQGHNIPTYYFETFRIVGFPAVVEHHATVGVGYEFSKAFAVNAGYMHAFEAAITEQGTDPFGRPTTLKSTLSEDSVEVGLTWRF